MGALSPRERQVLQLILQGMNNKQIGQALGISPRTVEAHRAKALLKSNNRNIVQLARQQALEDVGETGGEASLQRRLLRLQSELARIRDEIDNLLTQPK